MFLRDLLLTFGPQLEARTVSRAGYVPVERVLLEHLPTLSPLVVKVYLGLLLLARGSGPEKGLIRASIADLSSDLGVRRPSLSDAIGQLERMGWLDALRASNQHAVSEFHIRKPDASAQNKTVPSTVSSKPPARNEIVPATVPSTVSSTLATDLKTKGLRTPEREERNTNTQSGWEVLFESWWKAYPRQCAKSDAKGAFRKVVVDGRTDRDRQSDLSPFADFPGRYERLVTGTKRWTAAEFSKRDAKVVPYPATFIRKLDWITPPSATDAAPRLKRAWE